MSEDIVEGSLSTKAVIEARRRTVLKVLINKKKKSRDISYIEKIARKNKVEVKRVDEEKINEIAKGKTHGGVIAFVGEREYQSVEDILNKKNPFIAVLEGIEDPFNFGYCLRSLYAAGCDGVVVASRNWTTVVDVVTKSSAGASEFIDIVKSDDLSETIKRLKQSGLKVYGANRKDAKSLYETSFEKSLVLAIGGEKRGLSKKVSLTCDENIFIPYANNFKNAINGSSATAILSFEIFRQRRIKWKRKE